MSTVLFVSKPVGPPWNDSSKNLVRDLALGLRRYDAVAFTRRGNAPALGRARLEPIHPPRPVGFAPALGEQLRVLARLGFGARPDLLHFFFAPNPRTSRAARVAAGLRRLKSVQTVCSVPREDADLDQVLFAERVVVLSRHTAARFEQAGVSRERLVRIPPSVPPLTPLGDDARREVRRSFGLDPEAPVVLYPGDLEFGRGAELSVRAHAELAPSVVLVLACRAKTEAARGRQHVLGALAQSLGTAARVKFAGETLRILELVGASDVVCLPSDVAYAKMDYPLVLLEAMALARPVVVALGTPAAELAEDGAALAVEADSGAVAEALGRLLADRNELEGLGARARNRALAEHDRERMAAAYEALYDELLL